ncbi:hypothetical protein E2320_010861 [Naja naja]|nr:hypothetical protein E2320_010861 [Naja naja]
MENSFWKRQGLYVLLSFSFLRVMCASIRFSVPEEKKRGFLVANVLKELKLKTGELFTRKAHLVAEGTQEYFHLDIHTGNLLINDKIDREALCGQSDPCLLLSQLVLENPLEIFNIEIKIEDVNDNAPTFWKNEVKVDIPENIPISMIFPLELAQDDDIGDNSIQNYILSSNEHFQLEVRKNEDGNDNIYLVLRKTLDREKMPHLGLILMAIDGGVPKKTGTVKININVLDNNDNFPLFSKSEYKARIKENLSKGTLVIKVEATDTDIGSNAQILYSFHQVPERINNLFHLNEITGEITVWGQIDYEKERSYSMSIRATDGGGLPGQCKILIEVEDENDNPPEVSIISLTSTLKEDSPSDTMVALFSVRDQDSGDNSKTVCSVEMNLPFVLKATTNNFYQLVLQSPLDRETVTEYNITITAIDWGSPRLTSTRLINVQISDVNDNSPLFEKSSYDMQIRENNIPGLLIGSVHALDLDTKLNAKVSYLVLSGKSEGLVTSYISINSETGNMYALRSLDYEQIRGFRVTVRASDGGSPSLSSEVIVQIHIIDENDNAPFFLYPLQNNTSPCNELVPKSAEAGYLVTKVVAVDADSGQNSWLSYELLKATDPALFSIGAQNGEVKTRRALNERDTNKQRLVIQVRDNGLPPQTSTVSLNVLLVDGFSDPFLRRVDVSVPEPEEDKTLTKYLVICLAAVSFVFLVCIVVFIVVKVFKKDPQSHFTAAVPHFPPASVDTQENCADSQNGSLSRTYRYDVCLTGGSLSSEFRFLRPLFPVFSVGDANVTGNNSISAGIQGTSEEVAVNGKEREAGKMEVSRPSRQVVLFFISLCSSGMWCEPFRYSVPEEKKAGSIVANVLKDLKVDVKELSARRAQLISKSSRQDFQLDPHSGNIILRHKIDREALCVQVEDVNDNSPTFSKNQFLFEIPEQTPINVHFPLEAAHDLDKGKMLSRTTCLAQTNILSWTYKTEVIPQFILTLEAVDGGIPRRTGTAQIIIDILDNNDNMPQFEQTVYKVQLMENSHPGSLVAKVEATDKDIGSNAHIIYTFSQAPAEVKQSYWEITLVGKIDYEENHNYELSIKATDGGGLSTYCKVLVDIEDENDNAPEIIVSSITNPLPENSPWKLWWLFGIRDQDSGDNGRTTCNTEKNLPFILKLTENNYYQLVTQQPLDREETPQYNITITATDQGSPRLTSVTVISILLSDVNDNPPMFLRFALTRNNIPGLLIGSVYAVDMDTEENAKVTYSLLFGKIREEPASSYISINSETGNLYAIRSMDYEDIQDFQVMVRAVDKGSLH